MRKLKSLILKQCTRKKIILSPKKLVLNPLEPSNCIAKTMCVLKCVKVHLKILGCIPVGIDFIHLPFYGVKIPFNSLHITCIFTILIGNMVATFWFYIREVKTFGDFSESVFWGSRSVLSLVLYTLLICRKTKLAQFFQSIDEIAGKRKFIQTQLTGPFMFVKVHNDRKRSLFLEITGNQNIIFREIYETADRKSDVMQRCISFYTFIAVPVLYVIPIAYKSYHAYYTVDPTPFAFQLFYQVAYV